GPEGRGFSAGREPQTAVSGEVGTRLEWRERVHAGAVGFVTDLANELIPFESPSGRTAFRNAGSSRRYGAELDWAAWLLRPLRWTGAVTFIDARFRDYQTPVGNFAGKREPGIPGWQVYQEFLYRHSSGVFAAREAFVVDGSPVNDAATATSPTHYVLNLRAGYEHTIGRFTIAPFIGLNNLTNSSYDGTVRLNALGGRYFEEAPGFNVFGGV